MKLGTALLVVTLVWLWNDYRAYVSYSKEAKLSYEMSDRGMYR